MSDAAALRPGFAGPKSARVFTLPALPGQMSRLKLNGQAQGEGLRGVVLTGKEPDLAAACAQADLVIVSAYVDGGVPSACRVIDRKILRQTGALAIWPDGTAWQIIPAARSARIWMGQNPAPDLPPLIPRREVLSQDLQ